MLELKGGREATMAIHKRKNNGAYVVSYRDKASGKHKVKYCGVGLKGRRKAEEFEKSLSLRGYEAQGATFSGPTFAKLANSYLEAKLGQMAETSYDNVVCKLKKIIGPAIGATYVTDLTPQVIDGYIATRKRSEVKNTTIHRELTDIMAVLNWAVTRRYISHNPIAKYKKPKRDDAVIQPPTKAEAQRLFDVAAPHLKRVIALSYFAGIRPGAAELLPIPWGAIDWDARTLFIESAKKNGLATRTIPLHNQLFELLQAWYKEDRKWSLKKGRPMPETIIHFHGRQIKRIKTAFNSAKEDAKITRRLRPYDFRHAFATMILAGRGDLKATSELLGHTRTDTTTRIYQHVNPDMHRQAVDVIPGMTLTIDNVLSKKKASND